MSIRIVNDAGKVLWFTSSNWRRLLAFASLHGWPPKPALDPDNWDESLTWDENWEIVGGASLSPAEAQELAEAVDRGLRADPHGASVAGELHAHAELARQKFPDYDPAGLAAELLKQWSRFRDFARAGAIRVDLTD